MLRPHSPKTKPHMAAAVPPHPDAAAEDEDAWGDWSGDVEKAKRDTPETASLVPRIKAPPTYGRTSAQKAAAIAMRKLNALATVVDIQKIIVTKNKVATDRRFATLEF
jgi:hypothetical protein